MSSQSAVLGEKKTGIPRWSANSIKIKDDQSIYEAMWQKKKNHWIEEIRIYTEFFFQLGVTPLWSVSSTPWPSNTNILGFKSRDHCKIAPEGSVISFPKAREGNETRAYTTVNHWALPIVMDVAYILSPII